MNRLKKVLHRVACLSAWGAASVASAPAAAQMGVYQMYYVPVPETAARTFNRELQTQTVDEGRSILSISIVLPNTLIYWDHSEDGYESDVTLPTQATSEV